MRGFSGADRKFWSIDRFGDLLTAMSLAFCRAVFFFLYICIMYCICVTTAVMITLPSGVTEWESSDQ